MARRSDHSREQIKEMVLNAAYKIILKEGSQGFSTRKVAKDIGYTVGSLYLVYKNSDDLMMHINAKTLDEIYGRLNNISTKQPINDYIIELAMTYYRFAKEYHNLWKNLFEFNLPLDEDYPDWYEKKLNNIFALIISALGKEFGDNINKHITSRILWASTHGICELYLSQKANRVQLGNIKDLITDFVNNYFKGIRQ